MTPIPRDARRAYRPRTLALAALALLAAAAAAFAPAARAHFTILLADPPAVRKGEATKIRFAFGHPFEREQADADPPARFGSLTPRGECIVLTGGMRTIETVVDGKTLRSYEADLAPDERGDSLVHVVTAPMVHGEEVITDFAKLVLHVQAEKGWERAIGKPLEIVPLTRPYGLFPGASVRATVLADGKPLAGCHVAIERYMDTPPLEEDLPPDEQITRTERTDALGDFATTLPEPGWWVLCAETKRGEVERDGKRLTEIHRALLWVYVEPPAGANGASAKATPAESARAPAAGAAARPATPSGPSTPPLGPPTPPLGALSEARVAKARADLANLETAIRLFQLDTASLPGGLEDLIQNPGVENWRGPYLSGGTRALVDPWGHPYQYAPSRGTFEGRSYRAILTSGGADGQAGGVGADADLFHFLFAK